MTTMHYVFCYKRVLSLLIVSLLLALLLACAADAEIESEYRLDRVLTEVPETFAPTPTVDLECDPPKSADVTTLLKEMQSCKPDLPHNSKVFIRLFIELQEFKTNPEFHKAGFGDCCRFNSWLTEAESLRSRAGIGPLTGLGVAPGGLRTLGFEYLKGAGGSTGYKEAYESAIEFEARKTMGLTTAMSTVAAGVAECASLENADVTAVLRELQNCKPDLSQDSRDFIKLFIELQKFKTDPEFHKVGFGVCCRFNSWLKKVESLQTRAGQGTLMELGVYPMALYLLGSEYVSSRGQPTDYARQSEGTIKFQAEKTMGLERILTPPASDLSPSSEVIGKWMYDDGYLKGPLTILRDGGQFRLIENFQGLDKFEIPIVEIESSTGRRFTRLDDWLREDYVISRQGDLEIWDIDGLATTARKLR